MTKREKSWKKNVFCNVYFFMDLKAAEKKKMLWKCIRMEIPGFYYGIFIKYLYKLYKGRYISLNVSCLPKTLDKKKFFFKRDKHTYTHTLRHQPTNLTNPTNMHTTNIYWHSHRKPIFFTLEFCATRNPYILYFIWRNSS